MPVILLGSHLIFPARGQEGLGLNGCEMINYLGKILHITGDRDCWIGGLAPGFGSAAAIFADGQESTEAAERALRLFAGF